MISSIKHSFVKNHDKKMYVVKVYVLIINKEMVIFWLLRVPKQQQQPSFLLKLKVLE
jgi:hypothetical protein